MRSSTFSIDRIVCLVGLVLALGPSGFSHAGEDLDKPMFRMPDPVQQIVHEEFQEGLIDIWLKALKQNKEELKINVADAISRSFPLGYEETQLAAEELLRQYQNPELSHRTHVALARAIATLDLQSIQPVFEAELPDASPALALAIEPALARWKSESAIKQWRAWLDDPKLDKTLTKRSIASLVAAQDLNCLEHLKAIVADDQRPYTVRQDAARAMAVLFPSGQEEFVRSWVENTDTPQLSRLLAATTLSTHSGQDAIDLMLQLGRDPQPAVALVACQRLSDIDMSLLYDDMNVLSERRDSGLRMIAVAALAHRASADDARRLLEILDDYHPVVRHEARVALEQLAETPELRPIILSTCQEFLANLRDLDHWRTLEQAAILAGNLDHEPTADSLFELFYFERDEVAIAATWSISRMMIAETYPRIVEYATTIADQVDASDDSIDALHEAQLTHLFQCLGLADYRPAKEVLSRFVPKRNFKLGMECRAAAIWALGFIMQGDIDDELAAAINARMLDGASSPAEVLVVRQMSAVALGRMKAQAHEADLRGLYQQAGLAVALGWCAAWAVEQITGEKVPDVPDRTVYVQGFFLAPLTPPREDIQ